MNLKLTLAASVAALTIFTASAALAATGELNSDANVREGPGTGYDIVGYAGEGDNIYCVDFDGGWCELADDEGYIAGSLINFDGGYDDDDDDHDHHHDYYDDVDVEIGYSYGGFEFEIEY
jgi:uncharacterized protein YraI